MFEKEKGRAGRDQLTLMLNATGVEVSAPTVGAIMREKGLRAVRTSAWKQTTVQDPQAKTAHIPNHMLDPDGKRDFTSMVPGTRLRGNKAGPRGTPVRDVQARHAAILVQRFR